MFKKFFKSKPTPPPLSDGSQTEGRIGQEVTFYELELTNMEGIPSYVLSHQLTVGSEIGNIIVSDPSLSPRHATFFLKDEVLSVIDHGSFSGTVVNGKKIESGKQFILEEKDKIQLGDLEMRIRSRIEEVSEEESEDFAQEDEEGPLQEEEFPEDDSFTKLQKKRSFLKSFVEKNKSSSGKIVLRAPLASTNSLIRVFSVLGDLVLSYTLVRIFAPFDDFKSLVHFIPDSLFQLADVDGAQLWKVITTDYPIVQDIQLVFYEIVNDLLHLSTTEVSFSAIFIIYAALRFISVLILGVSFSEFCLGVRFDGNAIWARIGGGIRTLIGLVTWPFIIFDLTSLFSRRTFKEFITLTNITSPSVWMSALGLFLYPPLLILFLLLSPLIQGLEFPQELPVKSEIVNRPVIQVSDHFVEDSSENLRLNLRYNPEAWFSLPDPEFKGEKKVILNPGIIFYHKKTGRQARLELYKNFNLKELLAIAMRGNFFLFDRFPRVYNFVYGTEALSPHLKKSYSKKDQSFFGNEVMQLMTSALSLSVTNFSEIMLEETPLIRGYREFKMSFLQLIGVKKIQSIRYLKLGDAFFLKVSVEEKAPFDLIIPLVMGEGKILKISFSAKENREVLSSHLYDDFFAHTQWLNPPVKKTDSAMRTMEAFDALSSQEFKTYFKDSKNAERFYGLLFETTLGIFKTNEPPVSDFWKKKLPVFFQLVEFLPSDPPVEGVENPREKLLQNIRNLRDAFEGRNFDYFGIPQPVVTPVKTET